MKLIFLFYNFQDRLVWSNQAFGENVHTMRFLHRPDWTQRVPNVCNTPPQILRPLKIVPWEDTHCVKKPPGEKNKNNIFPFHVGARPTELFCEAVLAADQKRGIYPICTKEKGSKNHCKLFFLFILFSRAPPHSYVMSKHKIFDAVIHSITGTNNNICIFKPKCNSYNIRKKVVYKVFTTSSKEV